MRYGYRVVLATLGAFGLSMGRAADVAAPIHVLEWPESTPAAAPDAKTEALVEQLLAKMSTEEKVGQLVQTDIGSILAGGNSAPDDNVRIGAARWLDLVDAFYRASVADASPTHPAIPILFGIDAVHGHTRIPGATVFPHNVGLGAANDAALIEKIGQATAAEIAVTGIDWTFAPTIAVVRDVRWGRSYESYSEDPALVAKYARAMVIGLQGEAGTRAFMGPGRALATIKHFLGDGGTIDGRDQFNDLADERTLRDVHAAGYPAGIYAGALTVMASYNSWQGTKMHGNHVLLTDVLKGRWHFPGFVVGDWNAQEELPGCTKFDCPDMLTAGVDMYMAPDSWRQVYANLLDQVQSGRMPQARLDDAVRRIVRVKAMAGLFEKPAPKDRPEAGQFDHLGSAEHRAVARQAVRESLVLLKNDRQLLPLNPRARILVAGSAADDIGIQCGGWTIDWQGDHNSNADFPGATSIYGGIKAVVEAAGGSASFSPDGSFRERPAAAIVVYGETPYAEFEGDRETLEFSPDDHSHLQLLRRLHAAHIPVVSVFISGRPMWVNREINASDAFVAAWLPGSEGEGIADLLFRRANGSIGQDFTGRLSFSWPGTAMPVRFDQSGHVTGALYARGFGLSVGQQVHPQRLSEDPKLPPALRQRDTLFHAGHVTAPWSIYVSDGTALTVRLDSADVGTAWSGLSPGSFSIGGRAADYRSLARTGATIEARYRVESPPQQPVHVGMACEAPYGTHPPADPAAPAINWTLCGTRAGAWLDMTAQFASVPIGTWRTLSIPLACLARDGADLSHVAMPFAIASGGKFALRISDVRIVHGGDKPTCK
jgi:beta-glucosidase